MIVIVLPKSTNINCVIKTHKTVFILNQTTHFNYKTLFHYKNLFTYICNKNHIKTCCLYFKNKESKNKNRPILKQ